VKALAAAALAGAVGLWPALEPAALSDAGDPGLAAIRASSLSAHVRFLADDLLEGRAPGTPGHAIAARYLAAQLQSAGAEPAGEDGGWFQRVPLVALRPDPARCSLTIATRAGDWEIRSAGCSAGKRRGRISPR